MTNSNWDKTIPYHFGVYYLGPLVEQLLKDQTRWRLGMTKAPKHAHKYMFALGGIVANLKFALDAGHRENLKTGVSLSLRSGKYSLPAYYGPMAAAMALKPMRRAIDFMALHEYVVEVKGYYDPERLPGRQTILLPGPKFEELIGRLDPDVDLINDIYPKGISILRDANKYPIQYDPTPETERTERRLAIINALAEASFELPPEKSEWADRRPFSYNRIFNRNFELGGRLYALFQNLESALRRNITCNGNAVVEYDYSGMHIRMLYQRQAFEYRDDPYDISATRFSRNQIKAAMQILLNARTEIAAYRAFFQHLGRPTGEYPRIGRLFEAIKGKHEPIAAHLHTGVGLRLQKQDSEIALDVLWDLANRGIPVLAVHDSFIVEKERGFDLVRAMRKTYIAHLGGRAEIRLS